MNRHIKICKVCKNIYYKDIRRSFKWWEKSKYCSRQCHFKAMKGNKQYEMTDEIRKKIRIANKIRFQNPAEREKISKSLMGKKSPMWKGGLTPLKKQIYCNGRYKNWRMQIFLRDNFTCVKCKKKVVYI